MGPQKKFSKVLSLVKSSDFIYPVVMLIFFTIVITLFTHATTFLINNIDKIFSPSQQEDGKILDMAKYEVVAKKLNLEIFSPENNIAPTAPIGDSSAAETGTETSSTTLAPDLEKNSVTLNILNTTNKKGVAALLAKKLEASGFQKAETGNSKKSYTSTTIIIKEEKKDYLPLIEEAVKASYPDAVTEVATGKTDFDITIMIGAQ